MVGFAADPLEDQNSMSIGGEIDMARVGACRHVFRKGEIRHVVVESIRLRIGDVVSSSQELEQRAPLHDKGRTCAEDIGNEGPLAQAGERAGVAGTSEERLLPEGGQVVE